MPEAELPPDMMKTILPKLLELTNNARTNAPYGPLKIDKRLQRAAITHCTWMAKEATRSHKGKDPTGAATNERSRAVALGYTNANVGEIIAEEYINAEKAMEGWLKSPEHSSVIHDPQWKVMGGCCILSVVGTKKTPYWCCVFGSILPVGDDAKHILSLEKPT
jgi:uncharacterized protein YkwD